MPNTKEKLIELMTEFYGVDPAHYGVKARMLADHLIANGVTIQEWIPVSERLPEQYHSVIVWTSDRELGEAQYDGTRFEWCSDENYADATHWMPLPEPPKGE